MKSRPVHNANGTPKGSAETLYCICRKPDTGKWMIGCDGCDDWFHGECVNVRPIEEDLVDQYFCPGCQGKNLGITTWKRKCRLPSCPRPAATSAEPPSKYCTPEHGIEFFKSKIPLADYSPGEVAALANAVNDAAGFRKLGDSVPAPSSAAARAKIENLLIVDFEKLRPQKEAMERQQSRFTTRTKFINMAKDRQKRVTDELRAEENQPSKGSKEICGFDMRLALDDEDFADWCESEEGKAIFESGAIGGREDICIKKKCEKHKYWLRIAMEDLELEERLISEGSAVIANEENGLRQRQNTKSLMEENQRLR
ncbi:hypothetical protein TWF481_004308 [Arthrobotrys musiformis]|uniref:PHD-type domain-containing protein n=1 Tax=Arthrobotrys musiformis TaxID=47236 RepID=A0AAV9WJL9_9PEZI